MSDTIERVLAEYPDHIWKFTGDSWNDYTCQRCDTVQFHGDVVPPPCRIMGEFTPDGMTLLTVYANACWLADHWDELTIRLGNHE